VRYEEVYIRIGEERTLWSTLCQRIIRWFGHVMKRRYYVGSVMEGNVEGKAPRGRPRDKNLGQFKMDTGEKIHREVKELEWDRKEWRAEVYQS
jgi:hypothetical protein